MRNKTFCSECTAVLLLLFKFRFIEIFHFIWKVVNVQPISFRIFNFNTILIPKLTKSFHPYIISKIALEGSILACVTYVLNIDEFSDETH